jgi:N-carbamoylputrescine amidase
VKVKLALLQNKDHGSQKKNINVTIAEIDRAAKEGAQVICTQELFLSDYFCRTQDANNFDKALKLNDPLIQQLQEKAAEHKIVIIASLFEEAMTGVYYNTALIIDSDGQVLGKYRKSHIPQDPFFEEKFYFTPGDSDYPVWHTQYGKIGLLICWDQWFPEAARILALKGAEIILIPTAIGWLPNEKKKLGQQQYTAWLEVQRGHAVANACFLAAVNRVGIEEPIEFWGQSFICNYAGEVIAQGDSEQCELVSAECDLETLKEHRMAWPFFRDRRIDSYPDILKRQIDEP